MGTDHFQDQVKVCHIQLEVSCGVQRAFQTIDDGLAPGAKLKTLAWQSEGLAGHLMDLLHDVPKLAPENIVFCRSQCIPCVIPAFSFDNRLEHEVAVDEPVRE